VGGEVQPVRVKLDPGAKVTGVAIVREAEDGQHVLDLAEIAHKVALAPNRVDSSGLPRGVLMRAKQVRGFQTGDMVRGVVARGIHWIGRVAVRVTGRFNLQTGSAVRQGIGWKWRRLFERSDGHHSFDNERRRFLPMPEGRGLRAHGFVRSIRSNSPQNGARGPCRNEGARAPFADCRRAMP
jgi:hypothetical protein